MIVYCLCSSALSITHRETFSECKPILGCNYYFPFHLTPDQSENHNYNPNMF